MNLLIVLGKRMVWKRDWLPRGNWGWGGGMVYPGGEWGRVKKRRLCASWGDGISRNAWIIVVSFSTPRSYQLYSMYTTFSAPWPNFSVLAQHGDWDLSSAYFLLSSLIVRQNITATSSGEDVLVNREYLPHGKKFHVRVGAPQMSLQRGKREHHQLISSFHILEKSTRPS